MSIQDTSASGGFLIPDWVIRGEPRPPEIPRWGTRVEGVRMYDYDGEPDEYNDLRVGETQDGQPVLGVGCDCGCGYAMIDLADLAKWLKERKAT